MLRVKRKREGEEKQEVDWIQYKTGSNAFILEGSSSLVTGRRRRVDGSKPQEEESGAVTMLARLQLQQVQPRPPVADRSQVRLHFGASSPELLSITAPCSP